MRLLYLLLFALLAVPAAAQVAWINSVQVMPVNPTSSTPIKVIVSVSTGSGVPWIDSGWVRDADTLRITNCYTCGVTTIVPTFVDTIRLGLLPAGQFTIKFLAKASYIRGCTSGYTNTAKQLKSLRVSEALATTPATGTNWTLYPVPAPDHQLHLRRPDAVALQSATLLDLTGRVCYASSLGGRPIASLDLNLPAELAAGFYTLRLHHADGHVSTQRLALL